MILIKPSFKIEHITPDALGLIEQAGRTCYKSECRDSIGFTEMIVKRGHLSVIEHAHMTVRFICDRGVSHELVRHRLASFSQESTRYCDYNKGHVTFIIPPWVSIPEGEYNNSVDSSLVYSDTRAWFNHILFSEVAYNRLRSLNWKPEQARSVLPNSLKTEIVVTANFREWLTIFELRCADAAHPQMRELMISLRDAFKQLFPVLLP